MGPKVLHCANKAGRIWSRMRTLGLLTCITPQSWTGRPDDFQSRRSNSPRYSSISPANFSAQVQSEAILSLDAVLQRPLGRLQQTWSSYGQHDPIESLTFPYSSCVLVVLWLLRSPCFICVFLRAVSQFWATGMLLRYSHTEEWLPERWASHALGTKCNTASREPPTSH